MRSRVGIVLSAGLLMAATLAVTTTVSAPSAEAQPADPVVALAGDISCAPETPRGRRTCHQRETSDLIVAMAPQAVFALGDNQYERGELANFNASYDPTWGRFKSITRPVVGNHEYLTAGAAGYYQYYGDAATPMQPGCTSNCLGYYSFNIGTWHVAVINSECGQLNGGLGCAAGSPQQQWLDADLAANPNLCTAVLSHRPRWASANGASANIAPLVETMVSRGVDLLFSGHQHLYERFAPQNAAGQADPNGIVQFVVGTGGRSTRALAPALGPNGVVQNRGLGVLKLTLRPTGYDHVFVPDVTAGNGSFRDAQSASCH